MDYVNIEIGFPSYSLASIKTIWQSGMTDDKSKASKLNETLLFICYVFRQLGNLGNHPSVPSLYECISEINDRVRLVGSTQMYFPHHCISHTYKKMDVDSDAAKKSKEGFSVIEQPLKGKGFIGKLSWHNVKMNRVMPIFILDAKGFGLGLLTGKDIPLYALDSILVFYSYLLSRYKTEKGYFEDLIPIMTDVLQKCLFGETTLANQELLAFEIIKPYDNKWD